MCRNITTLRGLEPPASTEEIEAGALQYVRKITGVRTTSAATSEAVERAVAEIAAISARVLSELPPRRIPPPTEPPPRRIARRDAASAQE
ncbi:DUF2277 domain-containing protein [Ilumatobacter sp.]|uniref:DUF2277 domain-containing protein n=1 Tax=Ilumatobacter sp. TaxID=1967498 RepID=UPI003B527AD1